MAEEEEEEESGDGRNSTTMSAPRIVAIAAGEVHTLALSSKGEVYSWGDNQLHQCARQVSSSNQTHTHARTQSSPLPFSFLSSQHTLHSPISISSRRRSCQRPAASRGCRCATASRLPA